MREVPWRASALLPGLLEQTLKDAPGGTVVAEEFHHTLALVGIATSGIESL